MNLDGEIATSTPVDFRVDQNAFEVVVPQHVTHVRHDSDQRYDDGSSRSTNDS